MNYCVNHTIFCAELPFFFSQQKNVVGIIVLVEIPSVTTIAAVGWGGLKTLNGEKFWRSKLSQAAQASPYDSSSLLFLQETKQHSHNWLDDFDPDFCLF